MGSMLPRIGWRAVGRAGLGLALAALTYAFLARPSDEGVVVVTMSQWPTSSAAYAAAATYTLKVDGVKGSSTIKGHADEIDLASWSFALSNALSVSTGTGKVVCGDLTVSKGIDKASIGLGKDALAGVGVPNVTLTGMRTDISGLPTFLTVHLTNAFVTSYGLQSAPDAQGETESISYGTITVQYTPQKPDGSFGPPITTGWNCTAGTPVTNPPPAAAPTTTSLTTSTTAPVYGSALSLTATVAASSGTPDGTVTFTDGGNAVCTDVTVANGTAGCTFPASGAGDNSLVATFSPASSSFAGSSGSLTVTVAPAPLTITADNQTMVYGAGLPALTVSYSGFVNGDTAASLTSAPAVTTTATAGSHVAGSPYTITASGAVDGNYTISYVDGTLSITPAPLTITADNQSKAYGAALPALTASYLGFVNGDTAASLAAAPSLSTTATVGSHVAGGPYAITASGASDSDYSITYVAGALTVTPVPLLITPDNATKVYGAPLPSFTATYTGFVNLDTAASLAVAASLSTTATAASHVAGSPYAITASGAVDTDYVISYGPPGALTVTPAPLTITAENQTKAYGAPLPTLTVSYSGFVNGDSAASLSAAPTLTTTATAGSHVLGNPYAINVGGAADSDYTITYVAGVLNVTPVPLLITADNQAKVYGAPLPALTATYSGLVNGDTVASLPVPAMVTTTATQASHVAGSPYPITAGGAVDADYVISYGPPAALTVTPAPLTISADNQSKVYGAPVPTLTASFAGLVNGDTPATFGAAPNTPPVLTTTAGVGSHVAGNPYPITVGGASDSDYTITFVPGLLTVTPAPLTVTADDKLKVLGAPVPVLTVSYSGFVNGDTVASLTHPAVAATTATASSPPSGNPYPITVSGAVDPDYSFTYVSGSLTVLYRFEGFRSPAPFGEAGRDVGRGLLVSFQLCDVNEVLFSRGSAWLTVDGTAATPAGTFNSGSAFRFVPSAAGVARCGAGGNGEGESAAGTYQYRADVSALAPGLHLLTAHVDDGTQEDVWVMLRGRPGDQRGAGGRVAPAAGYGVLAVSPARDPLGASLTVSGRGFKPGASVRVDFGAYYAGTFTAASDGSVRAVVTPPLFDPAGAYQVAAVGTGTAADEHVLRGGVAYGA